MRERRFYNRRENLVRNVGNEDVIFVVELVKQSSDVARYEGAVAGAPLAGIHRGAFAKVSIFSPVWLTNVSHREIPRLATVNPHLVCHVDKYSPRRNFDRAGRSDAVSREDSQAEVMNCTNINFAERGRRGVRRKRQITAGEFDVPALQNISSA